MIIKKKVVEKMSRIFEGKQGMREFRGRMGD
jgi:hypothetical protein